MEDTDVDDISNFTTGSSSETRKPEFVVSQLIANVVHAGAHPGANLNQQLFDLLAILSWSSVKTG